MRSPRFLLAAIVLGTIAVSGAGAAVDAAPKGVCGGHTSDAGNGWVAIQPQFTAGSARVTQLVAVPFVPDRMYASNGSTVMRTDDAGCHWRSIVTPSGGTLGVLPSPLDELLHVPTTAHIVDVAAPSSATASDRIYVAWNDTSRLSTRPHLSYYDGKGWHEAAGLPRYGSMADVTAVANVPTSLYALVDPARLGQDPGLYASGNGGASFNLRNPGVSSSTMRELKADPLVNTTLYALGSHGIVRSVDGGQSFTPGTRPGSDIASYDVTGGGGLIRMVQGHTGRRSYDRSDDAGISWVARQAPVAARDVAMQPLLDQVAVSDGKDLWIEANGSLKQARKVTPRDSAPTQLQFSAPLGTGYSLVGVRGGEVLRSTYSLAGKVVVGKGLTPIVLLPQLLPHHFPSTLTPGNTTVRLAPGAHKDVSYRLLLPRTPSPIDVMFLVDTTDSTEHTIDGLRQDLQGIVNDLATVGLDVDFGVAEFRDYPPTVGDKGDGEIGDKPYDLRRKIGRSDASLALALSKLKASGGGDPAESDLTALYQSTTGAGQRYPGMKKPVIPPGQDAGYRPEALRLAVLATDNAFHRERDYLTPSWHKTVKALIAHRVHPIGLAVQTVDQQGNPAGFRSLKNESEMGAATGTFAPRGGVDCDGDLSIDVGAGSPFVCKVPLVRSSRAHIGQVQLGSHTKPLKLAPAITTAAESLPDLRTVGLRFHGPARIARLVGPAPLPTVNLKNDNTVSFTVRYSCPNLHKPHLYKLGVDAGSGSRVFASAATQVACGAVPLPPHHPVVPPETVALAIPPAAAAAPPAPSNPVPNPNPNPNPALNANVGFASQEEEQRQLAFAGAETGVEEDTSTEMAMSRLGLGAAVLLAGAVGYAARSRFSAAWHRS